MDEMNKTIKIEAGGTSSTSKKRMSPGKHPLYRGVRFRGGKWVSEIREPRKTKRIWLGTYQFPEMAAMAFDVAALALRGRGTKLNFPDKVCSHPKCISSSSSDIQAASFATAFAFYQETNQETTTTTTTTLASERIMEHEFMDEEEIFNMPKLVQNMAEGMLISPPRMSLDSPEASEGESLWSYY